MAAARHKFVATVCVWWLCVMFAWERRLPMCRWVGGSGSGRWKDESAIYAARTGNE